MPVYEYECELGHIGDKVHSIADCDKPQHCSICGANATRRLSAPAVRGDYPGYRSPITGDWIEGRRAHKEDLAKHGCRILETGEREEMVKRKKSMEDKLLARVEDTATEVIKRLPQQKFEILAGELTRGGDADFIRATAGE